MPRTLYSFNKLLEMECPQVPIFQCEQFIVYDIGKQLAHICKGKRIKINNNVLFKQILRQLSNSGP